MNTPIVDFIDRYANSGAVRLHMPGNKGKGGDFRYDLTEIPGADSLYFADGIIAESENNACRIFGSYRTFYSAEGSSLCIRAMLRLVQIYAQKNSLPFSVIAARNVHSSFVTAAGLLDADIKWIYGSEYLTQTVTPEELDSVLSANKCAAVYVTSPDYLGNMLDIKALSAVCRSHGVLLVTDNAHGAYLKFTENDMHPVTLGADLCCDSAHKTLPVLTGGAYLHISDNRRSLADHAKSALALFGSTSPSYLILRSLDAANTVLSSDFRDRTAAICKKIAEVKDRLISSGFELFSNEPMKITIRPKSHGQTGYDIDEYLRGLGIFCEFADKDNIVFMPSPYNDDGDPDRLCSALSSLPQAEPIAERAPHQAVLASKMSIRNAMMSESETLPIDMCENRICAKTALPCPPAVPVAVCGEIIDRKAIEVFKYYGISECEVVAEQRYGSGAKD